ncbi:MAG: hypothetical protein HYY06_01465 [Deltaproteobacteria bacterium]|nr:hypothetical protein [Deltaproteobacteria bacterium]
MVRAALVILFFVLSGCGNDESPCTVVNVPLAITVDGRSVATCGTYGWELRVRSCDLGGDACAQRCGACQGPDPIDRACEGPDACEQSSIDLAPGDHRVCVEAILVNGDLDFETCEELSVSGGSEVATPLPIAIDTGDAFPCIREWTFDGSTCCNEIVGACNPP